MNHQAAKEKACLLAARRGMALFIRGQHMFGVHADGALLMIAGSHSRTEIWVKAHEVLLKDSSTLEKSKAPYRLFSPTGYFEARSLPALLWAIWRKKPRLVG